MIRSYGSPVVERTTAILGPMIQVFAVYVLVHGHHSPGGGFQAGVLLGAGLILSVLAAGPERVRKLVPEKAVIVLGAVGVSIYAGTGLAAMLGGGNFLDYAHLPLPGVAPALRRYWGIFSVECGVFVAVSSTMLSIFYQLAFLEERPRG